MHAASPQQTVEAGALYRGRFAPSPTGPLHFGSLVAAVASYLDARAHGGEWLVRIEDVDKPRAVPGAADSILRTLEHFGFEWNGPVLWQSHRDLTYRNALQRLQDRQAVFPCACTRRELASVGTMAIDGAPRYPGTCRNGLPPAYVAEGRDARSVRFRVDSRDIRFEDRCQGLVASCLERDVGDFVLLRADGLFAYQLAVVVDDADQGVTDVVRGADLLASTARQIAIQRALGVPTPRYLHTPVAVDARGDKLSKQTGAPPVRGAKVASALAAALRFLGQPLPGALASAETPELWQWAIRHWQPGSIPRQATIPIGQ